MQRFGYRNPRYVVNFPVLLTVGNSVQTSRCSNISLDGIRLQIGHPLPANSLGQISFDYEDLSFDLCVRVAHCGSSVCGLRILCQSEAQRDSVSELIGRIADRCARPDVIAVSIPNHIVISRRPASL